MESGSWFPSIKSDLDEIKDFTFPIMSDSHMSHMQINSMQFFKNCYLFCQHFIEENLVNLCEILKEIYLKCFVRNIRLNNFWCPILQSFVTKKKKKDSFPVLLFPHYFNIQGLSQVCNVYNKRSHPHRFSSGGKKPNWQLNSKLLYLIHGVTLQYFPCLQRQASLNISYCNAL